MKQIDKAMLKVRLEDIKDLLHCIHIYLIYTTDINRFALHE